MTKHATFRKRFIYWLDACLSEPIPSSVRALSFGVCERELCNLLELNGTSEFSCESASWTWSEMWSPQTERLRMPISISSVGMRGCYRYIGAEIIHYMKVGSLRHKLLEREGVCLDSVDGGYLLLWQREREVISSSPSAQ